MINKKRLNEIERIYFSTDEDLFPEDIQDLINEVRRQYREIKALKLAIVLLKNKLDIARCNIRPNDDNFKLKNAKKI